jgi:hypothetical protein
VGQAESVRVECATFQMCDFVRRGVAQQSIPADYSLDDQQGRPDEAEDGRAEVIPRAVGDAALVH